MGRTLNGEVVIDDPGNFNEQAWLENVIAIAKLLASKEEDGEQE